MSTSLSIQLTSTNFVDLKTRKYKRLHLTNNDSTDVTVSVVVGKTGIAGGSTVSATDSDSTYGSYIIKNIEIPVGVSLVLDEADFTKTITTPGSTTNLQSTTILAAVGDDNYVVDLLMKLD